ncbi:MAG TPA: diaminopimelate epimerase [bacterium]|jgi:diaminopimelate epimerase
MRNLEFEKWHGTGNDFVLCSQSAAEEFTSDIAELSRKMCARHFGIGSDGLLLIGKSSVGDYQMRMWNPDGSEAQMCGNGLRCVVAHLKNHGLIQGDSVVKMETGKGVLDCEFVTPPDWGNPDDVWVRVDMGQPVTERHSIPVAGDGMSPVVLETLNVPGIDEELQFTGISMGNPHAVIFVDKLESVPLGKWGPMIEKHTSLFPEKVNTEFVEVIDENHVMMAVWERGAGPTLSCGSGTCAIQAACHLTGKASDELRVDVPGGSLLTRYTSDGRIHMSGPAVKVFDGMWVE